jgi:hypothetical protein
MYRWEVKRELNTVDISPINEFKDGKTISIIGKLYKILLLLDNIVPEINPNSEDIITIIIDSLKIFLKYFI